MTGELEDNDDGWEVIDKRQAPRVPRTKKHQEPVTQTQTTSWYDWYNSLIYPTPMPARSSFRVSEIVKKETKTEVKSRRRSRF